MKKDSDITPALSQTVQQVSSSLKWWGSVSLWSQIVFGIISALALLLGATDSKKSPGSGFGFFFAICGLVALGLSIYFALRYTNISKSLLNSDPIRRPTKTDTIKLIKTGLTVNLAGMLLSLVGTQAIVGNVLFKVVTQIPGSNIGGFGCLVVPADIFSVQANTTAVTAHFIGLIASTWLLNRITK